MVVGIPELQAVIRLCTSDSQKVVLHLDPTDHFQLMAEENDALTQCPDFIFWFVSTISGTSVFKFSLTRIDG